MIPPTQMSGCQIAAAIRHGSLSCIGVLEAVFRQIDALNKHYNAFAYLDEVGARQAAIKADADLAAGKECGPLHGVPFTVKDLLNTKSMPTTYCSEAFADHMPDNNSIAVSRMLDAGGILVGKTTSSELAMKVTTSSRLFGVTRNPWSVEHSPGGSSGGAAVAVAAGMAPLAVSTDGGGSSRIPAAACGILGLKPTIGAIPHETWPYHFANNSTVSLNTRSVDDLVLMWNVMAGSHAGDPWSRRLVQRIHTNPDPLTPLRTGRALFIRNMAGNECDPCILEIVESTVDRLSQVFAETECGVVELARGVTDFDVGIMLNMLTVNLAARVRQMTPEQKALLDPALRPLLIEQAYQADATILQTQAIDRSRLYDQLDQLLQRYDFVLTPTVTAEPPLADLDEESYVIVGGKKRPIQHWWSHLGIANLTGHPAISIPCGFTKNGLPVGLHAIGQWDNEQSLIDLASVVSEFYDWSKVWPESSMPVV